MTLSRQQRHRFGLAFTASTANQGGQVSSSVQKHPITGMHVHGATLPDVDSFKSQSTQMRTTCAEILCVFKEIQVKDLF